MFSPILICAPFIAQGFLMGIDELYFHRRRGLPAWEIWGHPFDTLTAFVCILFLVLAAPTSQNALIYIALAVFSALVATKDEFVHLEKCEPGEQWLHSVLFMLHPTVFFCSGYLWLSGANPLFLQCQLAAISIFFVYQVAFWAVPWQKMW